MRKLLALICALLFALAAVGCGSSGSDGGADDPTTTKADTEADTEADDRPEPGDATADEYAMAFARGLSSGSEDNGQLVLPEDAAVCVAPKFVEAMTVEQLHEAGVTVEDASDPSYDRSDVGISEAQAVDMVAAFGACDFDIYGALAKSLAGGLGEDVLACTEENLDRDLADALLVKVFSTNESNVEFEALLADLTETCDLPTN